MAIITSYSSQSLLNNLTNQQNKLYELYNKINTNQKYTDISENPIAAADLIQINNQLAQIGAYARNIENATTQINAQDEVFSQIVDKMREMG